MRCVAAALNLSDLKKESLGRQRSPLNVCELMKNERWATSISGTSYLTLPSQDMPAGKRAHEKHEGPFAASNHKEETLTFSHMLVN